MSENTNSRRQKLGREPNLIKEKKIGNNRNQKDDGTKNLRKLKEAEKKSDQEKFSQKSKTILNQFLEEDKAQGTVSLEVIKQAIKACGGYKGFLISLILCLIAHGFDYLVQYMILKWNEDYSRNVESSIKSLWLTTLTLQLRNIFCGLRALIIFLLVLKASRSIHASMTYRVLHPRISEFLDRVPKGQILNRFSRDINSIDSWFKWAYSNVMLTGTNVLISLIVVFWTTNGLGLLVPLVVFLVSALRYQRQYMGLKREITRLKGITNSPVLAWSTTVLKSSCEVRALNKLEYVHKGLNHLIDENMKNSLLEFGLNAWFRTRINLSNFLLVLLPGYCLMVYQLYNSSQDSSSGGKPLNQVVNTELDVKQLILFIIASTRLIDTMAGFLSDVSIFETNLISFERCLSFESIEPEEGYQDLENEKNYFLHSESKSKAFNHLEERRKGSKKLFNKGKIEFVDLDARYPTHPDPVLKGLKLTIQAGEKVGIVGRTGAGKTSLIKLLWRCLRIESGSIYIDGIDIEKVGLKALRNEVMVISQETALFKGTLRENISPHLQYLKENSKSLPKESKRSEKLILEKLKKLGFSSKKLQDSGLDFEVGFNGSNLSRGEKQMVCFLRAVADKKKVTILDEATAGIDLKTEERLLRMNEEELRGRTLLVIAHRVQTVLGCDKILVLEDGSLREFGEPGVLAADPKSEFSKILQRFKGSIDTELIR